MIKYRIQSKIRTLADNAVNATFGAHPSFKTEEITFTQWEYNYSDGWLGDAWLAEADIEAENVSEALNDYGAKLSKIIPRIALIGQTYIRYRPEPYIVKRADRDFAMVFHVQQEDPVGLMFMDDEKKALNILLSSNIPDKFFSLWNDAVNTTGYTAKILLMASAVEALVKKPNNSKDFDLRKRILGETLDAKLFAQRTGLRQRLSHGEYLEDPLDGDTNYVNEIHKRIIVYFNTEIFKESLLSEDVVDPQRNFTGNVSVGRFYLKSTTPGASLDLRSVVGAFDEARKNDDSLMLDKYGYEYVFDNEADIY
jgi:hypothetical protein